MVLVVVVVVTIYQLSVESLCFPYLRCSYKEVPVKPAIVVIMVIV